jgi:hypothetical protein
MEGFGGGGAPTTSPWDAFNSQAGAKVAAVPDPYSQLAAPEPAVELPKVLAKSGLKLGGGGKMSTKKDSLMAAMAAEDNLFPIASSTSKNAFDMSAPIKPAATPSTPLSLALEEKITVQMNREGAVEACDVKGTLTLTANTDAGILALVTVNKAQLPSSFNFATHPKVDKKMYEQGGVLSLKGGKGFPVARPVGILRWSYSGFDAAPLTINCWPEDEGGSINVNIEMEMTRPDLVLTDVNILLPLGTTDPPSVVNIDGVYKHDPRQGMMCWHFDRIDASNLTGSLEFSIPGNDTDVFFPVQIGFRSETLLCPLQITNVTSSETGAPIPNQMTKSFGPESYTCA